MLKILPIIFALFTFGECQCPGDYTYIKGRCFKAYNYITASWNAAQNLCFSDQNGHLAIVDSCTLLGDLAVYFHISGNKSTVGYWIGATDIAEEGSWKWIDGTNVPLGVPFWASVQIGSSADWFLEPSGGVNENCALLSPSDQYYFRDEDCYRDANPLCQTDLIKTEDNEKRPQMHGNKMEEIEDTFCNDGFDYVSGQCFFIQSNKSADATWKDAREICHDLESELAVLSDCNLFGMLVYFIELNYPLSDRQSYWIGASDQGDEGAWYWVDNTPVRLGLPFWGQYNQVNQPNEDTVTNCLDLYRNDFYYFHDGDCNYKSLFICQKDPVSLS